MSLYDQYRKEHPIASEPSEFREIVESEVKQALEWYKDGCSWCDKLTTRPTTEEAEKLVDELFDVTRDYWASETGIEEAMHKEKALAIKSKILALAPTRSVDEDYAIKKVQRFMGLITKNNNGEDTEEDFREMENIEAELISALSEHTSINISSTHIGLVRAHIDEAHKMVCALCDGSRKWIMRVPAQPDDDPDLVIGRALREADKLLALLASGVPSKLTTPEEYEAAKKWVDLVVEYEAEHFPVEKPQPVTPEAGMACMLHIPVKITECIYTEEECPDCTQRFNVSAPFFAIMDCLPNIIDKGATLTGPTP